MASSFGGPIKRRTPESLQRQGAGMPTKGVKAPGDDAIATLNTSAEVSEADLKPGQRRKAGQDVQIE
jgi:hypothetical protein